MSLFQIHTFSRVLRLSVGINVVIPEPGTTFGDPREQEKTFPVLYLLHGLSDDETIWERRTSIERYADERRIAVVMPCAGRSWYTDAARGGYRYFEFIANELPEIIHYYFKNVSRKREDTFIGGNSMGGYGSMKIGLTYPERFSAILGFSGAYDLYACINTAARQEEFALLFGSVEGIRDSKDDLFRIASEAAARAKSDPSVKLPAIYMCVGADDFLLNCNRAFRDHLAKLAIPAVYEESDGNHDWRFWDRFLPKALDFAIGKR